jgi:hypothetical protein
MEVLSMTSTRHSIIDGPDKPGLQWSLTKPGEHDVQFRIEGDALNAQILRIEEGADGFSFDLRGTLTSGPNQGTTFYGYYNVETRSGWLEFEGES